LGLIQSSQD